MNLYLLIFVAHPLKTALFACFIIYIVQGDISRSISIRFIPSVSFTDGMDA